MIGAIAKLLWSVPGGADHDGDLPPPPTDRIELGRHADRLLHDPVLQLAFELVERDLVKTILASAVGAAEEREAAYRLYWAKEQVRAKLRSMLGNAKVLEHEQKQRDAAAARAAERGERYA